MRKSSPLHKKLTRRTLVFAGVQAAAGTVLLGRLYYLQLANAREYKTLAEGNSIKIQLIPPQRGQLLDARGKPLATNQINFRVFLSREKNKQAHATLNKLSKLLSLSPERKDALHKAIDAGPRVQPLLVKEYVPWDELSRVEFHMPELLGLMVEEGQLRYYGFAEQAAHMIGYVGKVSEEEQKEGSNPLLRLPDFKIGKEGAERLFDTRLRGVAGSKKIEVNALGLSVREIARQPAKAGEDIRLTIDAELQAYAAERLGEESGAIVVMDTRDGGVKALASMPAYDPNSFSVGITQSYWNELMGNEKNPLMNKAIAGQYPPGSTFKMIVALAALKDEMIAPHQRIYCPGHYYLGNHRFNCWKAGGHGAMDLQQALAQSCDTYFYHLAHKLGMEKVAEAARSFGLGQRVDAGLPGERSGLMPMPEWKKERYGQSWTAGDTVNAGIGQGYVLATPIQLAVMTARMATGKQVMPRLEVAEEVPEFDACEFDPAHLQAIRDGMWQVNNSPRGTAYWHRITQPEFTMAGKTGTSQVRRITQRGMDQSRLPWKYRHHALFVGFAPYDNPRYVASVIIEHGGSGSAAAAPVAKDVLLKMQSIAKEQDETA